VEVDQGAFGADGRTLLAEEDELAEAEEAGEGSRSWTPQEKALHEEARLKAKAKRRLRRTSSREANRESLSEAGEPCPDPTSPKGKGHDRKSRMGKGRGLPKKGTRARTPGSGRLPAPHRDPFRSGSCSGLLKESILRMLKCSYAQPFETAWGLDMPCTWWDQFPYLLPHGDTVYATVVPELEEGELEKTVQPMVLEYFEHGDTLEVVELLRELNLGGQKAAVSSLAVSLSLEGKASHRELTSRLLSDLVGKVLSPEDIATAFDSMLHDLPDLILDTPEAPQVGPLEKERPGRREHSQRGGIERNYYYYCY
ncbi:hypothetical protein JD844_025962, partial [Phrynosoma platyrhinos]